MSSPQLRHCQRGLPIDWWRDSSHAATAVVGMLGNVLGCEVAAAEAVASSVAIRGPVVAVGCGTLVGLPPSSLGSCRGVSTRKAIWSLVEVRLTGWGVVPRVNTHDAGDEIDGMSLSRCCWSSVKDVEVSVMFGGKLQAASCKKAEQQEERSTYFKLLPQQSEKRRRWS